MTAPLPATTVLVLRPEAGGGFRIFLVKRHGRSAFMPSAWVFPGGRLDPTDALHGHPAVRGGEAAARRMGLPLPTAVAHLVAGARETLEEAGIWLGDGALPPEAGDATAAGRTTLARMLADAAATLDLDRLHPWSWWTTPESERRRFDTRFVMAVVAEAEGRHDARETVDSGWFAPADALAAVEEGRLQVAPPTWWTLRELARLDTIEDAIRAAHHRIQRRILPILEDGDGGLDVLLPGHPRHPDPEIEGMPTRIRFAQGRWWAAGP